MAFRKDLLLISSWIESNTKVLDLGCGNGELLKILKKNQNVRGYGIDNDIKNIKDSLKKDVNVLQIDLDNGLSEFETNSFDYVVLAQSLQVVKRPKELIDEMLRIGKEIIVSFPNIEERDKSWDLFINDPEWKKVYKESIKEGPIVSKIEQVFLNPTSFSKLK